MGFGTADDAAVYRIAEDRALVLTVDLITPIVDSPRDWGAIAATNSISDVFAMGGRPLAALNVACFSTELPMELYREVIAGASEAALRQGCPIVGGHTIKDKEPKFGLAVIGEVHPDRILRNAGALPGDVLLLTKALGSAALSSALKQGRLEEDDPRIRGMVDGMLQSNGPAVDILRAHDCHALTDVTGFGLSGHAIEMAIASNCRFEFDSQALPVLDGALEFLHDGPSCGGARSNAERVADSLELDASVDSTTLQLFHDPQTSGPLLAAVPADRAEAAITALRAAGYLRTQAVALVKSLTGAQLALH